MTDHYEAGPDRAARWGRAAVWLPGLAVAIGAAVATAHGLYEVAAAAGVPAGIAWIYPLITDGLALVAYAATARLHGSAARYAWVVVTVSAGLSGLAQASYLASPADAAPGGLVVSPALRFGVGAWPAIAAAVVAHLLYLLAAASPAVPVRAAAGVRPDSRTPVSQPDTRSVGHPHRAVLDGPILLPPEPRPTEPPCTAEPLSDDEAGHAGQLPADPTPAADSPARDRARDAAAKHRERHNVLPTVRELQALADVGRGTAADALKQLRDTPQQSPTGLRLVTDDQESRTRP